MTFPTDEQRAYIGASLEANIYLKACPGSGKTEVLAAMVCKSIQKWRRFPSGIAVLTFSNSATDELKLRLTEHLGEPLAHPHCVSTFDSFLLTHIVAKIASQITGYPGRDGDYRIRLIDKTANIFRTKTKICGRTISACKYDYDLDSKRFVFATGELTDVQLNAAELSAETKQDLVDTKKRFWKGGFATYRDIDMIALMALRGTQFEEYLAKVVRRFPITVVDECQDLSAEQLDIVRQLARRGMKFHFVGDLNQSIYGFRKSNPERVRKLLDDLQFTEYELTANWRSGQAIVDLCSDLLNVAKSAGNPNIEPLKPKLIQYQQCPSELTPLIIALAQGYQDVVIVARGHSTLQRFSRGGKFSVLEDLALSCVSIESQNLEEVRRALKSFAGWLAFKLNLEVTPASLYCPIEIESKLAWRRFVFNCLKYLSVCGASDIDLTWKQWAALAKRAIRQIPDQPFALEAIAAKLTGLKEVSLVAPAGLGSQALSARLSMAHQQPASTRRYATIHQVKGETHDVTVVVSSLKSGSQSHWKDWLKDPLSEAARFAYVASSRPRHLLIWGVKVLKPNEKQRMVELGFDIC